RYTERIRRDFFDLWRKRPRHGRSGAFQECATTRPTLPFPESCFVSESGTTGSLRVFGLPRCSRACLSFCNGPPSEATFNHLVLMIRLQLLQPIFGAGLKQTAGKTPESIPGPQFFDETARIAVGR